MPIRDGRGALGCRSLALDEEDEIVLIQVTRDQARESDLVAVTEVNHRGIDAIIRDRQLQAG